MSTKRMRKIGLFPGQFDPVTNGHLDVIRRGAVLFDELVVAVGINPDKREFFTPAERAEFIRDAVGTGPNGLVPTSIVRVEQYTGLTVEFARRVGATAILRGIRDAADLGNECRLALANRLVGNGLETVFLMTGDQFALTSSSLIRQVVALGGDVRSLASVLPPKVIECLIERQRASNASTQIPTSSYGTVPSVSNPTNPTDADREFT